MTLSGKLIFGYIGIGAAVAIVRQVSHQNVSAGVSLLDLVAWPYSVYQWAASASAASAATASAPMKKLSIGVPVPVKTLQKSASGSSTPGLF